MEDVLGSLELQLLFSHIGHHFEGDILLGLERNARSGYEGHRATEAEEGHQVPGAPGQMDSQALKPEWP